ncbi:MAG: MBL fold metallo-hydrolase [Anaerolineales bacterium]
MPSKIHQLPLGMLQTNCYIIANPVTKSAVIIDPAAEPETILSLLEKEAYRLELILATHAHFDHVSAAQAVQQATGIPFRLHAEAAPQLAALNEHAARFGVQLDSPPITATSFIQHGEQIMAAGYILEARYTPGHAPGHLIFILRDEATVFAGDCVFYDSVGRTDLEGGDLETLKQSLLTEILPLPDHFKLLSGHGPTTTVGRERTQNFFLAQLLRS